MEREEGARRKGRPTLRWRDNEKRDLKRPGMKRNYRTLGKMDTNNLKGGTVWVMYFSEPQTLSRSVSI